MGFLLVIVLIIAFTVFPVMVGARIVGARNTGFGPALLAVIILACLSAAVDKFITSQLVAFLASAAAGAFLLAGILGTTFWRGLAVSVIIVAVQMVAAVVLIGAVLGGAAIAA